MLVASSGSVAYVAFIFCHVCFTWTGCIYFGLELNPWPPFVIAHLKLPLASFHISSMPRISNTINTPMAAMVLKSRFDNSFISSSHIIQQEEKRVTACLANAQAVIDHMPYFFFKIFNLIFVKVIQALLDPVCIFAHGYLISTSFKK